MPREISVQELARHIAAGGALLLIDVRQPWEHALAALPGSVLIPLGELPRRLAELQPTPGTTLVAYCHHGIRSRTAGVILKRAGFENVHSLAGGIDAWSLQIDPDVPRY